MATERLPFTTVARALAIPLAFAGLTVVFTWPQAAHLTEVRSHFDPLFSIWRMAWIAHQLPRDPLRLFDANIFHPAPLTLAYSDAMVLPGLLAAPALWLGASGPVVYNLLLAAAFALSGAAMAGLVTTLTGRRAAGLVSGIVYAYAPFRFEHFHHLELQFVFWIPLTLYFVIRTIERGRLRDGLLAGATVAGQMLSSIYYGVFLLTFCLAGGLGWMARASTRGWRRPERRVAGALLAGLALAMAVTAFYSLPYVGASRDLAQVRRAEDVAEYSALPRNYLASPPHNVVYGWTADRLGGNERNLFPGTLAILLAIAGLWPPWRPATLLPALGAACAFDLSLGLNGHIYPWLYANAAPYEGLRVPARAALFVLFFFALLAGQGVNRLLARVGTRGTRRALLAGILGALFLEYRVDGMERLDLPTALPEVYGYLGRDSGAVLLELPVAEPDEVGLSVDVFYMYYSTFHWQRLLNGYSGFIPTSYSRLLEILRTFPDARSIAELRHREVDYVLVHQGMRYWSFTPDERLFERVEQSADLELVNCHPGPGTVTCVYRLARLGPGDESPPPGSIDRRP